MDKSGIKSLALTIGLGITMAGPELLSTRWSTEVSDQFALKVPSLVGHDLFW